MTRIHHVDEQVGLDDLFEGRLERLDQPVRQLADEPHGVAQEDVLVRGQAQPAGGRVERGEEHVLGKHLGPRQGIEQRRFAGVGVAHDGGQGPLVALASLALRGALPPDDGQLGADLLDALLGLAAIGLELGFTFAADGPGGATLTGKVGPVAGEPRHEVLQLGQLDLELALAGSGALGEDVEDQRRAVDDLGPEDLLEIAGLGPGEFVVEEHRVGIGLLGRLGELLGLARPDERAGVRRLETLDSLTHHGHPGGGGQFGQLVEGIGDVPGGMALEFDADQEGAFGFLVRGFDEGFHRE